MIKIARLGVEQAFAMRWVEQVMMSAFEKQD